MKTMLSVGCGRPGEESLAVPDGFRLVRLSIDPADEPDILMDARNLNPVTVGQHHIVYVSHMIEHVYPHEVVPMLYSWRECLRPDGVLMVRCPDLQAVCEEVVKGVRLDRMLYLSPAGPITPLDLMYGYAPHIESLSPWYAHHTGFSKAVLRDALEAAHFHQVEVERMPGPAYELHAVARR